MTEQEMIDVIQAHIDGKAIQSKRPFDVWRDTDCPSWDFYTAKYRVKPEPFECWVNVYANKIMAHTYKNDALGHSGDSFIRCAVHMREVEKEDE